MRNNRLLFTILSGLLILVGTFVAIRYAQGYRLSRQRIVKATGLLSANSLPTGASVFVNGALTTATDTTLNLSPGTYDVEIRKEGYFSWKKKLKLESELVTQTNALLFPTAPGLTPLTFSGAQNLHPSPDGQRIFFITASASATRNNGLYTLDLTDNPLALQRGPRQIARNTNTIDLNKADFLWSPESDQILVSFGGKAYLLDAGRFTDLETAHDMSSTLKETLVTWKTLLDKKYETQLAKFPPFMQNIASGSATSIFISPDQDRLLYTATADLTISPSLIPPIPASNSQPEERHIHPGNTYVYDRREDRNFLVRSLTPTPTPTPTPQTRNKKSQKPAEAPVVLPAEDATSFPAAITTFEARYSGLYTNSPQWLPDSRHLIFIGEDGIRVSEYDSTNMTQVYAGPLSGNFVYPWPNGTKLLILTSFNQGGTTPRNLYAVSLR